MTVDGQVASMPEEIALPRQNGDLVFETPWEARAFGLAVALNEGGTYAWKAFSEGLAVQIAQAEREGVDSAYYERWLQALEKLALEQKLVTVAELADKVAAVQVEDNHGHGHHHH